MPVDLSLYKIIVIQDNKEKTFVFPIGTKLPRMSNLFISNKYLNFIKFFPKNYVVGGLPKLNEQQTTIKLVNAGGDILDEYTYSGLETAAKNITFKSNQINDKSLVKWQLITN